MCIRDSRYIVQNYAPGDEIYLFGFSRGAYTVRSLCGLINNCGVLRRLDAQLIQTAFEHYKRPGRAYHPDGEKSVAFRAQYSHVSRKIRFIGAWDTVGALGIRFRSSVCSITETSSTTRRLARTWRSPAMPSGSTRFERISNRQYGRSEPA